MGKSNIWVCLLVVLVISTRGFGEEICGDKICKDGEVCIYGTCPPDAECDLPICAKHGTTAETTAGTTTERSTIEEIYCRGVTCPVGQVCRVAYCTPMCLDGGFCPHDPCGTYCS